MQKVRVKYVTEFHIEDKQVVSSNVIGIENATKEQKAAIAQVKSVISNFVKAKLSSIDGNGTIKVVANFTLSESGLELSLKIRKAS